MRRDLRKRRNLGEYFERMLTMTFHSGYRGEVIKAIHLRMDARWTIRDDISSTGFQSVELKARKMFIKHYASPVNFLFQE